MNAIKIDLNDYAYAGEGANGASYNHKSDPRIMMKLYNANAPYEIITDEYERAQKVYAMGIPTPRPGDFVTDGQGRYGIRFERIQGKKSFSRAISDEPQRLEELAREFARMCLQLHSTRVDTSQFPSIKDEDIRMLDESPFFKPEERERVRKFILSIPDTDTALHGDLQYSNAILSESGKYFIDLGDFSYGHPYFDLGQVLLTCYYSPDRFIREVFHLEPATAREFWKYFVKEYFGENADLEAVTEMIRPFSGLKTLIIERNVGYYHPHFHKLLEDIQY